MSGPVFPFAPVEYHPGTDETTFELGTLSTPPDADNPALPMTPSENSHPFMAAVDMVDVAGSPLSHDPARELGALDTIETFEAFETFDTLETLEASEAFVPFERAEIHEMLGTLHSLRSLESPGALGTPQGPEFPAVFSGLGSPGPHLSPQTPQYFDSRDAQHWGERLSGSCCPYTPAAGCLAEYPQSLNHRLVSAECLPPASPQAPFPPTREGYQTSGDDYCDHLVRENQQIQSTRCGQREGDPAEMPPVPKDDMAGTPSGEARKQRYRASREPPPSFRKRVSPDSDALTEYMKFRDYNNQAAQKTREKRRMYKQETFRCVQQVLKTEQGLSTAGLVLLSQVLQNLEHWA